MWFIFYELEMVRITTVSQGQSSCTANTLNTSLHLSSSNSSKNKKLKGEGRSVEKCTNNIKKNSNVVKIQHKKPLKTEIFVIN